MDWYVYMIKYRGGRPFPHFSRENGTHLATSRVRPSFDHAIENLVARKRCQCPVVDISQLRRQSPLDTL